MAREGQDQTLAIGVIGARRVRHGIGPFVAMHLARLGADVAAIAGTSETSVAAAQADLQKLAGISPRGYASVREMFAQEELQAVAICSPDSAHPRHLQEALGAGLHVLCEKPLVFDGVTNPAEVARPLVEEFAANGLLLAVNEQWPYTLPTFDEVHPGVRQPGVPPREFRMLLCPGVTGTEMIPNSLPHVLSMLFELHSGAGVCSATVRQIQSEVTNRDPAGAVTGAQVRFEFASQRAAGDGSSQPPVDRATNVIVDLRFAADPPRPARYAIDGQGVDRLIEQPGYRMFLQEFTGQNLLAEPSAGRKVPLPDPLPLLLADFLNRCRKPAPPANHTATKSLQALWAIYQQVDRNPQFDPAFSG